MKRTGQLHTDVSHIHVMWNKWKAMQYDRFPNTVKQSRDRQ